MRKLLIILLIVGFLSNCAPPRAGKRSTKYRGSARIIKKTSAIIDTVNNSNSNGLINYADTTIIEIKPEEAKYLSPIEREFNSVKELFKAEKYQVACPKIAAFAETFDDDDSLKYEAEFMHCECLIYQNKIANAKSKLTELINNRKVTNIIKQKALVRLGQIYCYENNKEQAQLFFDILKKEFPNSKYLKLANCDSVKK